MSEQEQDTVVLESKASAEQQAAATKIGWVGPENFRGDPEKFVDADVFIERGETVLPIVKKQNRELREQVETLTRTSAATAAALAQAQKAIEEIELRNSVATQKAVEEARREVKEQLARASEAGDHAAVAELTDQLTQIKEVQEEKPKPKVEAPLAPVISPALKAWNAENEWFGTDEVKTGIAQGFAQQLFKENKASGSKMDEAEFYAEVGRRTEAFVGGKEPVQKVDKVGGANHREGARNGAPRKGSYESMPADARAQCDADAKKFVGAGKLHKDVASWRASFAELYFQE